MPDISLQVGDKTCGVQDHNLWCSFSPTFWPWERGQKFFAFLQKKGKWNLKHYREDLMTFQLRVKEFFAPLTRVWQQCVCTCSEAPCQMCLDATSQDLETAARPETRHGERGREDWQEIKEGERLFKRGTFDRLFLAKLTAELFCFDGNIRG